MAHALAKEISEQVRSRPPVLIIDDEKSITETLGDVLQDEGYQVCTATTGEEGLRLAREKKPYLVFLDMWMPHKDGLETLRDILQLKQNIRVVMISGHATITNALEAMKAGAFDFLEKPFAIKSIIKAADKAYHSFAREESSDQYAVSFIEDTNPSDNAHGPSPLLTSPHPFFLSTENAGNNLGQRTLKNSLVLYGQCLHSGIKSGLVLEPLPINSGIHFAHLGSEYTVPAFARNVKSTALATTLMSDQVSASTIEHLMAALSAYKITNLLVKCNGEVPIFDGSSKVFCDSIEETGIVEQGGEWYEYVVKEKVEYSPVRSRNNEKIIIEPSDAYEFNYELNYPHPVGQQVFSYHHTDANSFKKEIAAARTFGFMKDIEEMQRMGLAAGGRLNNFILISSNGVVNTDLRFDNELVRHKILDLIGDLYLFGRPIKGKITAQMTGHADNVELLKVILNSHTKN